MTGKAHVWLVGALALIASGCSFVRYADIEDAMTRHKLRRLEKRFEEFNGTYRIGIPDTLNINVPDHPDVSGAYELRPDGNITFPLLGDVYAEGHTPMELAQRLATRLDEFLVKVEVYVTVTGFFSKWCYVFSRSRQGGRSVRFTGDVTIIDLLGQYGGINREDYSSHIRLIRDNPEEPEVYRIRFDRIMRGDMTTNVLVKDQDILYIPATPIAEFGYVWDIITRPVRSFVTGTQTIGEAPYAIARGAQEHRRRAQEAESGARYAP